LQLVYKKKLIQSSKEKKWSNFICVVFLNNNLNDLEINYSQNMLFKGERAFSSLNLTTAIKISVLKNKII